MYQEILGKNIYKKSLWIAVSVLLITIGVELIAILKLNSGHFIFTLDDPYIHLALAENILKGHYGVNGAEFSAPSSSILWPLIIAPFSQLFFSSYAVLFINILSTIGVVYIFWKLLLPAHSTPGRVNSSRILTLMLIMMIPAVNMIGLMFTGMEHSVQLFFTMLVIYGLVYEVENSKATWWFLAAIIVAPLIRYECLAISLPAILFLYARGYRARSAALAAVLVLSLGAFSFFLVSLGLDPFPTSIISKSSVVSSGGQAIPLLGNLKASLQSGRGILLCVGMLFLLYIALDKLRKKEERLLAFTVASSVALHLLVGKYDWYNRYEIYIWSSELLTLLYLNKERLYQLPEEIGFYRTVGLTTLPLILLCSPYIETLVTNPIASNNIYEQQYQMRRFATEYFNKPLAVNDLGLVSYKNDNYILDLWGLASIDALRLRTSGRDNNWMAKVTKNENVKVAMIYDDWFKERPKSWKKIGELQLGKKKITPARDAVSFYALDCASYSSIYDLTKAFSKTLPAGDVFKFNNKKTPESCANSSDSRLVS
jgi:hypothetical protein